MARWAALHLWTNALLRCGVDLQDTLRDLALLRWTDPTAGDGWVDTEQLALCSDLRAVYLALCLLAFRDVFGDDPEWDGYIRWFVGRISS